MMNERTTEIRLSVAEAVEAMEYYMNEYLLRHRGTVKQVTFEAKDSQFKIVLAGRKDAAQEIIDAYAKEQSLSLGPVGRRGVNAMHGEIVPNVKAKPSE